MRLWSTGSKSSTKFVLNVWVFTFPHIMIYGVSNWQKWHVLFEVTPICISTEFWVRYRYSVTNFQLNHFILEILTDWFVCPLYFPQHRMLSLPLYLLIDHCRLQITSWKPLRASTEEWQCECCYFIKEKLLKSKHSKYVEVISHINIFGKIRTHPNTSKGDYSVISVTVPKMT